MASNVDGKPLHMVTSSFVSFLRYCFSLNDLLCNRYRYVGDPYNTNATRKTCIDIVGKMPMLDEKKLSTPNIVVDRSGFQKNKAFIGNLVSASPNVFETEEKSLIYDGVVFINITCNTPVECSNLANDIALIIEENKRKIYKTTGFIRNLDAAYVSEESLTDVSPDANKWRVSISVPVSICIANWESRLEDAVLARKFNIRSIEHKPIISGTEGSVTLGSNKFVDTSKDFGILDTNLDKFNGTELDGGWYYLKLENDSYYYIITKITDNKTLDLYRIGADGTFIPYNPKQSQTALKYEIFNNTSHIFVNIPKII